MLARRLKPTSEKPVKPGKVKPMAGAAPPAPPNPYGLDPRVLPYIQPNLNAIAAQTAANKTALTDFTNAILAKLAEFGPATASTYDTAIGQSQALAQAGSDSLRQANGNADIQAILRAAGAPESQQAQVATNLGNVFNGGAAALFGQQGVAPGQQLIRDKASNVAFANTLPGINALAGTAALKNLLAGDEAAKQKVLADVPNILASIQQADAMAKYRNDTLGLSRDRIAIQRKNANKAAKPQVFGSTTGGYWAYDSTTGMMTPLTKGTGPTSKPPKIFGSDKTGRYVYDPNTGKVTPLIAGVAPPKKPKFTNVEISQFKNQAATAAKFAWEGEYDSEHGQWMSQPVHYSDALATMVDHGIPMWVAQGALKRYWTKPGYDADIASRAKASQNGDPVKPVWFKSTTGPIYARGKAPKARAAAEPAASFVALAPGADRPGASTSKPVLSFVARLGQMVGRKLTIGTGTNHNEYVIGTHRVSDHWAGNAADIPATGAELTSLGQTALIAAGADPTWARSQTGGLYNVNGVQVIFNSMEGGNHFNHLHIGVRSNV